MICAGFWTENNKAGMRVRRVCSDVREAPIERHENAILRIADVSDSWVVGAAELLVDDALRIPAGVTKKLGQLLRKILVDLEPHAA